MGSKLIIISWSLSKYWITGRLPSLIIKLICEPLFNWFGNLNDLYSLLSLDDLDIAKEMLEIHFSSKKLELI